MVALERISPVLDVTIAPGEFYFGGGEARIFTLLGSCVAITLWHPIRRIGGMCHYLLPTRGPSQRLSPGHYADEAIELFQRAIEQAGTKPQEYEAKLFGGGNMFEALGTAVRTANVSTSNIAVGKRLLREQGFRIGATDLGGSCHRKIYLDLWSGDVWVQRGPSPNTPRR